jgi:hypothetical protein
MSTVKFRNSGNDRRLYAREITKFLQKYPVHSNRASITFHHADKDGGTYIEHHIWPADASLHDIAHRLAAAIVEGYTRRQGTLIDDVTIDFYD